MHANVLSRTKHRKRPPNSGGNVGSLNFNTRTKHRKRPPNPGGNVGSLNYNTINKHRKRPPDPGGNVGSLNFNKLPNGTQTYLQEPSTESGSCKYDCVQLGISLKFKEPTLPPGFGGRFRCLVRFRCLILVLKFKEPIQESSTESEPYNEEGAQNLT